MIFDEIDIGIGGSAAHAVGELMHKLAAGNHIQIISITHSPQVASRADAHILIKKSVDDGFINIAVKELTPSDRVIEIARMLSGKTINDEAVSAAKQLLK
jgi:DNA repair protein RecN (Recombination protein N)